MRQGRHADVLRRNLRVGVTCLAGAALVAACIGAAMLWLGVYDVAATSGHSPPVAWLLHFAMQRSVAAHAAHLQPPDLDDPALVLRGATHFASGCAPCHGGPGQLASPIAQQMTPVPPALYAAARAFTPSQLFWIVQHGVKMTAMPAWPAQARPDEIWAMVAFLRHLPDYRTDAYAALTGAADGVAPFLPAGARAGPFDPHLCSRCHGDDGSGRSRAFPRIAGLDAAYLAASLRAFRDGSRPSGFMQPVAASLDDSQITAAADYYAKLRAAGAGAVALPAVPPAARNCISCHGDPGPRAAAVPDLAGQPAQYLTQQLGLLASGERPSSVAAQHSVSPAAAASLAAYFSSFSG